MFVKASDLNYLDGKSKGQNSTQRMDRQQFCYHPANRTPAYIPHSRTALFAFPLLGQVYLGRQVDG
jgi:hypothetical protein